MKKNVLFFTLSLVALVFMSFKNMNTSSIEKEGVSIEIPLELGEVDENGWGSWNTTDCLKGLDFRVKRDGYNEYAKKYKWDVEYRNRYYKKISFNTKAVRMDQKAAIRSSGKTSDRVTVSPNNGTYKAWFLVDAKDRIYVYVHKIRFDSDKDYSDCDK